MVYEYSNVICNIDESEVFGEIPIKDSSAAALTLNFKESTPIKLDAENILIESYRVLGGGCELLISWEKGILQHSEFNASEHGFEFIDAYSEDRKIYLEYKKEEE